MTPTAESGFARAACWLGPYMSCVLAVILCASCGPDQDVNTVNFETLSVSPIEGQKSYDRILDVASLRKLFELPATSGGVLIAPAGVFADTMGFIYVVDEADYRIHRFDSSGKYVTSYGEGQGTGPGEYT